MRWEKIERNVSYSSSNIQFTKSELDQIHCVVNVHNTNFVVVVVLL